ncbi:unnamed protein product [Cylindrotheca closterium]|uniref:Glucosidase 2 subunit beta n=1 Tax=Cylindrotheca closterium TaxID=2856 RepID=A0AAD2G8N0_9STRA|nr:unnamed protein product [Cylindrotheca closterium]
MVHFHLLCLGLVFSVSSASELKCATGLDGKEAVIPESWINDGYCDCPFDGKDEPNTEACSGSTSWPGLKTDGVVVDAASSPASPGFQCSKQTKVILPLSRINDGICDCCDGEDEAEGLCPDICEELFREEREAREKLEKNFKSGYNKRKHDLYNFKKLRQEKLQEAVEKEAEIASIDKEESEAQASIDELRDAYAKERKAAANLMAKSLADLVDPLSEDELKKLIIHSCQLAGEVSDEDADTCVALRLSALDTVGSAWSDDSYADDVEMEFSTDDQDIAEMLLQNSIETYSVKYTLDESNRRRLDEYHGDYDYDGEFDDDHYDPHDDEDDYGEESYEPPSPSKYSDRKRKIYASRDVSEKEQEVIDELKGSKFSESRVKYLTRSKILEEKINNVLDAAEEAAKAKEEAAKAKEIGEWDDLNKEEGEAESESDVAEEEEVPTIDTEAYNAIKETLEATERKITKGFRWGASAKLFFSKSSSTTTLDGLKSLAIGTLLHGNLGATHVWEVLQSVLPEYEQGAEASSDTCAAALPISCPPAPITRKGISYPPSFIVTAVEALCMEQATMDVDESTCAEEGASDEIPESVSDGLYGYFSPSPRQETDPLMAFFSPLLLLKADKDTYDKHMMTKRDLNTNKKRIERLITDLYKDIGGKDGDGMGPSGELYSMANECFSVDAGKYTYETCIFKEAKQKEGSGGGGTGLGKWTGMELDENGTRVMKWENGQKCWNGPMRSATVYVTCGPETKLISADEPDTCCYVFEMESHIACDEAYKAKMGLDNLEG